MIPYLLKISKLAFIVVDVANTELEWVFGKKNEYDTLGNLRNLSLNVPWIVLSAIPDLEVNIEIIVKKSV